MTGAPAGWFPSPDAVGTLRWWDGLRWTDEVRPSIEDAPTTPELWIPQPRAGAEAEQTGRTGVPLLGSARYAYGAPGDVDATPTSVPVSWPAPAAGPRPSGQIDADARQVGRTVRSRRPVRVGDLLAIPNLLIGIPFLLIGLSGVPQIVATQVGVGEASMQGTVVDLHLSTSDDGGRMCSVEAEFVVDGAVYAARADYARSTCPAIGAETRVIYTTASPGDGEARVPDETGTALELAVFPAVGFVLVLSGLGAVVRGAVAALSRRRTARS
ncbi:DUF2510 domain-containing protein [Cellulomonas sp. Root137]|uniref:DUF2510 domain-containing protein n=1 Tax=Cellulomonas sp. Root137 TaxID=1736459 RepID=UPI0006F95588|nr:DUF2510 domain-containing protein [Cellulomonas sp. Root137]KQY46757.1 hypothetical protein ASD18_04915 [Cellulomonas sp. Root137]